MIQSSKRMPDSPWGQDSPKQWRNNPEGFLGTITVQLNRQLSEGEERVHSQQVFLWSFALFVACRCSERGALSRGCHISDVSASCVPPCSRARLGMSQTWCSAAPSTESLGTWAHCSRFPGECCYLLRGGLAEPVFTPSHTPQKSRYIS